MTKFSVCSLMALSIFFSCSQEVINPPPPQPIVPDSIPPGPIYALGASPRDQKIVLTWGEPSVPDLDSIIITYAGHDDMVIPKGLGKATISGLTNGTPVNFSIAAKDTSGNLSPAVIISSIPNSTLSVQTTGPLNVVPGILAQAEGTNFGTQGSLFIGLTEVTDILEWTDEAIFFRIPDGVATGDVLKVKGVSPDPLKYTFVLANPSTSVKVRWVVDVSKPTTTYFSNDQKAKVLSPIKFTPPLRVKGEWKKSTIGGYGTYDAMWDPGALHRMWNQSGTIWIAETLFTELNLATMVNSLGEPKPMKFACEDGCLTRNVVEFESDWGFALKKEWAKTDLQPTIHSDPAVRLDKSYWYDPVSGYIICHFPVI